MRLYRIGSTRTTLAIYRLYRFRFALMLFRPLYYGPLLVGSSYSLATTWVWYALYNLAHAGTLDPSHTWFRLPNTLYHNAYQRLLRLARARASRCDL
jgi:glutathione S-transferase